MHRRSFIAGMAATGSLITLAGCDLLSREKKTATPQPVKRVKVAQWGQEKYLIYLPFYIAQEAGLFAAQGVEIDLNFTGNDDQVFAAVLRGDAQFGIGDPVFAAISRNRGGNGVVVGQLVDKVALWGVAKKGAKRRDKPADFAGARIGTFPRPSTTYTLLRDMVDRNNVPEATIIEVPIGSEVALLERGDADVVMMLEPAASAAVAAGYDIVTSFPQLWGPFAFTGVTAIDSYVSGNREIVSAFGKAMQAALDLARSRPEQAVEIARKLFSKMDRDVVANAVKRMLSDETLPTQFAVSKQGWAAAIRVRQAMKQLAPGDYTSVIAV